MCRNTLYNASMSVSSKINNEGERLVCLFICLFIFAVFSEREQRENREYVEARGRFVYSVRLSTGCESCNFFAFRKEEGAKKKS